jgi:hypothetical protein
VAAPLPKFGAKPVGPKAGPEPDWAAKTADSIDKIIGSIRSKTTTPLERLTRVVVYGVVCAILGLVVLVLVAIASVRALDEMIPGEVWPAHLIIGGIFIGGGLFSWWKRTADVSE